MTHQKHFWQSQYSSNNHSINKPIELLCMTLNLRFILFKEEKMETKVGRVGENNTYHKHPAWCKDIFGNLTEWSCRMESLLSALLYHSTQLLVKIIFNMFLNV